LIGAGAIRANFEAMFANGTVQAQPTQVHKVDSLASAMHHLVERVEVLGANGPQTAFVVATNVYHKTPQGWRMVAHHASPGTPNAPADISSTRSVLH
jgi:ketosteroid isomerase-like protein